MKNLDKLQERVERLVDACQELETQKAEIARENEHLREQLTELQTNVRRAKSDSGKTEKTLRSKNQTALKRISGIVDRIDQLQSEIEFS